jgi:hypothetical protein
MSGAGDQSPFTESRRLPGGSRRGAGSLGESEVPRVPRWGLLRRFVAAGIVVVAAVHLSWMPVRGLTLGTTGTDRHPARLLAGLGGGAMCSGDAMLARPGVHGSFAVPDGSCRGYRQLLPSGPGPGIRLLAFRQRAGEEPAWPQRSGCMTSVRIPRPAAAVIDPARHGAGAEVTAAPGSSAAPGRPGGVFPGTVLLTCVAFGTGGPHPGAGAGTAGRWCAAFSGSGGQVSCGDRASLPGRSPRYHLIWLVCGQCGTEMAVLFYDHGDLPVCVNCPGGQVELRP